MNSNLEEWYYDYRDDLPPKKIQKIHKVILTLITSNINYYCIVLYFQRTSISRIGHAQTFHRKFFMDYGLALVRCNDY